MAQASFFSHDWVSHCVSDCVCIDNPVETQKLAVKYHTEFAKISSTSPCPWLGPLGFREEDGARAKDESVWGTWQNQKQISGSVEVNPIWPLTALKRWVIQLIVRVGIRERW